MGLRTLAIVVAATLLSTQAAGAFDKEVAQLSASDAESQDWFGSDTAASGNTVVVGALYDVHASGAPGSIATAEGSAYVYERGASSSDWSEVVKLTASDAAARDSFGLAVAIDGTTAVIGAPADDHSGWIDAGSIYVFEQHLGGANAWGELTRLSASDASNGDSFGLRVAIQGDTIAASAVNDDHSGKTAVGSVYVFERTGGVWTEDRKIIESSPTQFAGFGLELDLDGDTLVVSSAGQAVMGRTYVHGRDQGGPGNWGEVMLLTRPDPQSGDSFGWELCISGDTVVVGARGDSHVVGFSGPGAGSAFVYERDQGGTNAWGLAQTLISPMPVLHAEFGGAVSLLGDRLVVGEPAAPLNGQMSAGVAYVFDRSAGTWSLEATLTTSGPSLFEELAGVLAQTADVIVAGAVGGDKSVTKVNSGLAYVFDLAASVGGVYCTAGTSASGCLASIGASGTASATAMTGFTLSASAVEGDKDGLFFFGTGGRQANPWGNGSSFQCVVPPVSRAGLLDGTGNTGQCDGAFAQDLNALWCPSCPRPTKNPGAGALVQAQLWHRDPLNTSSQTTGLSDAIEFCVSP